MVNLVSYRTRSSDSHVMYFQVYYTVTQLRSLSLLHSVSLTHTYACACTYTAHYTDTYIHIFKQIHNKMGATIQSIGKSFAMIKK